MNLYHLRYFATLAHLEHYTKAAELLAITQPSLSHAISYLESELGVALFEKDGRNVVLTKYGRIFLESVEKSLATLDCGVNSLKMIGTGEGTIELGFLRTLGTEYIPSLLRDFLKTQGEKRIHFHLHTGVSQGLIQGLKEKKFDLVFCSRMDQEPAIEYYPVSKQELVLIVPENHPLAVCSSIDLKDTLAYPHIRFTPTSGLRSIIDRLFEKIGQYPETAMEIEEDQVVAGMVGGGFGIAVVPFMPSLSTMNVVSIPITSPSWERLFYLAVPKNRYLPPAVKSLMQFAADHSALSQEQ